MVTVLWRRRRTSRGCRGGRPPAHAVPAAAVCLGGGAPARDLGREGVPARCAGAGAVILLHVDAGARRLSCLVPCNECNLHLSVRDV